MIKAEHVFKIYKGYDAESTVTVLNDLSLHINKGDFIAIMGPSGSGKTTLLNILSGLDRKIKGEIYFDSRDMRQMHNDAVSELRRTEIGFVFQEFHLLEGLTFLENVALPVSLGSKDPRYIEKQALEALDILKIKHLSRKYTWQSSRGQQQRAAIARAIVNNPKVIFADEPTGNLDFEASQNIMEHLSDINKRKQTTIVLVTHDHLTASYADKVLILNNGSIEKTVITKGDRDTFHKSLLSAFKGGSK